MTARRAALVELSLFLALVVSFIWVWRDWAYAVPAIYTLGLGLTIATHVIHRESPRVLGFRLDNFGRAFKEAAIVTVPLVIVLTVVGLTTGRWSREALDPDRVGELALWALLQQYLLQAFIHRRTATVIHHTLARQLTVAAIFAGLHLPNPVLVPATFVAGFLFAVLYHRQPNIFVLALCHAAGSTTVAFAFDPGLLHNMRVGPGYFGLVG